MSSTPTSKPELGTPPTARARFVEAHLPTKAESAVFTVLASSRVRSWTVAGVARQARVSDHEADQALRRFGAAGIVERTDSTGHPRRYRWRADMDYLDSGTEPPGRRDPVCGMPVGPDGPHVIGKGTERIVFCSVPCLVRWRHDHRQRRSAGTEPPGSAEATADQPVEP